MSALTIRHRAAALPLDVLLSMIPSLPRAALSRLTERAIDRIADPRRRRRGCAASDDDIRGGFSLSTQQFATALAHRIGDDVDAETEELRH